MLGPRCTVVLSSLALLLAARAARAATCARPTDPQGFAGFRYDTPTSHFDTENVRVWYTISGLHSVRPASSRDDGVPDDVARVGTVTEDALHRYAEMGYRPPLSDADADDTDATCGSNGGDGRLDVYLVHFNGADGMTATERCQAGAAAGDSTPRGAATRCASFIFAEANFEGRYPTVDEGIRTVLPHETFHAVQNAYDANLDRYWAEGTAQWAAKTLDPSLHDLERFLPGFFEEEGRSIDLPPGGVTATFLYGAAIWPLFLSLHLDPTVVREVLEEESTSGAATLEAARPVLERRGASLDDAWSMFWRWNASTGHRADPHDGYPDAARYPLLETRELTDETSGITSGSASYIHHLAPTARVNVTLESSGVHRAFLVPLEDGKAVLAKASALPAVTEGEALVVLTSLTPSKVDAPYTLRVTNAPNEPPPASTPTSSAPSASSASSTPAESSGGCSASPRRAGTNTSYAIAAAAALSALRKRQQNIISNKKRRSDND